MVELAEISDARDQLEIARELAQLDVLRAVRRYRQIAARADLEPRLWVYIYLGPRANGTRETDTACALAIKCGRWEGEGSAATYGDEGDQMREMGGGRERGHLQLHEGIGQLEARATRLVSESVALASEAEELRARVLELALLWRCGLT